MPLDQPPASDAPARRLAEAVARRSYGKLVALLAVRSGDLAAAEDLLSEAFVKALVDWPRQGCPANPEGWLLTVARRTLIDGVRRAHIHERALLDLQHALPADAPEPGADLPDYRLALLFACAHPALDPAIHTPLMLQAVLGVNAATIAAAFLVAPAAMSQRLVRAKTKIKQAGIPFRLPGRDAWSGRLGAVLDAIYAIFAVGWTDPDGTDGARAALAEEAVLLARLVAELLPAEAEALGLYALLLHSAARRPARRTAAGAYVPLAEQDPARWDMAQIRTAEQVLRRASASGTIGRYQLEGAVQSAHVVRRLTGQDTWPAVVQLYDGLLALCPSPVVAINRALAVAMVAGPVVALEELERVGGDGRLQTYQPYWAARAELLARTGAVAAAGAAYQMAIDLERDPAVRRFLWRQQLRLDTDGDRSDKG